MNMAVIMGAIIAGVIFGALPAGLGKRYGQETLGWSGFGACVVGSFIAGMFLSVPCCIVFTVIILARKNKNKKNSIHLDLQDNMNPCVYGPPPENDDDDDRTYTI